MKEREDSTEDAAAATDLDDVNGELLPDRELQSLITTGDGLTDVVYEPPGGPPDEI